MPFTFDLMNVFHVFWMIHNVSIWQMNFKQSMQKKQHRVVIAKLYIELGICDK